jgi:hypothetical protein
MDTFFSRIADVAHAFSQIASVGAHVWFFVLPPLLFPLFMYMWRWQYVLGKYLSTVNSILLEIIPPKDIEKSPQLMEGLFDGLAGTDKAYLIYEQYALGVTPPKFSLEVVGSEGHAHFYIRTPDVFRNLIEAHLYAQYPDVEIMEVDDYVADVPKNLPNKDWNLWGTDLKLAKADAYPIKTYHSFEETVTGKMMDPLAGLIEVIGKLPPGQKIWLQYIISPERSTWSDTEGKALVDEIVKGKKEKPAGIIATLFSHLGDIFRGVVKGIFGGAPSEVKKSDNKPADPLDLRLTPVQRKVLEAVESNIGKNVFRVKMRFMYLGRRENYNSGAFLPAIFGAIIKPYGDTNLNSIIPYNPTKTSAEYVFTKSRLLYLQRRLFRRYRDRDRDPMDNIFILSTSELATLFHLPDGSVISPALSRVTAKRGGSPSNLPI